MLLAAALIWSAVLACAIPLLRGPPHRLRQGLELWKRSGLYMLTRMPPAMLAAGFAGALLPADMIAAWLGGDSGWLGIFIASAIGIVVPSGPILSFPIALALAKAGVGVPQLVAFLTSWSLLSITNTLAWDIPILGIRFTAARLAASVVLPPLSGFLAALMIGAV
jgi:uncharacterized membrane protein YraQ (UPF0718 family)